MELYPASDELQDWEREFVFAQDSIHHSAGDGRLEMIRRVPFPDVAGRTVMEPMHQSVELEGIDLAPIPAIELHTQFCQCVA